MRPFRNLKIASVIEHELSQIFLKEFDFQEALVTIINVRVDNELLEAKVTFSVLPFEKEPEIFLMLQSQTQRLQHELLHRMNIKPMPHLKFELQNEI